MVGSLIKRGQAGRAGRVDNLLYQVRPATTWDRTTAGSQGGGNRSRSCAKSCRTPPVNGSNAQPIATAREVEMNNRNWIGSGARGLRRLVGSPLLARRQAQNVIESVTSSMQGGVEVVRIDFSSRSGQVPPASAIQAPARIALDIPGATNGHGPHHGRDQPGQPAFGQRGAGGRPHAPGPEPEAAGRLQAQLQGKSLLVMLDSRPQLRHRRPPRAPVFAESRNANQPHQGPRFPPRPR